MSDVVEPKVQILRAGLEARVPELKLDMESLDVDTPKPKTSINRVAAYTSQPAVRVSEITSARNHNHIKDENFDRVPNQAEINEMLAAKTIFRQTPERNRLDSYIPAEELNYKEETNSGFWGGVKSFVSGVVKISKDIGTVLKNTDWEKVGSIAREYGAKALDYGIKALQDPDTYVAVGNALLKGGIYLAKGTFKAILDPVGTVVKACGVLKSISDSIGLSDVISGLYSLAKAPLQYAYDVIRTGGDFSVANENYQNNLKNVVKGFVGAGKCFAEVTGLADLYHAGKYGVQAIVLYGQGRKLEAAFALGNCVMHTAFAVASAGSIAATVASGGAAIGSIAAVAGLKIVAKEAVKQTLKVAAKEGLEAIGKELAKTAMKEIGTEALEKSAARMLGAALSETTQRLTAEVTEHGAAKLVADNVKRIATESAEAHSVKFFAESGLEKKITESGFKILKSLREGAESKKTIAFLKESLSLSDEGAEAAFKDIRSEILKGKHDEEIIKALTEGASKPISKMLKDSTAEPFESGLKEVLKTEKELSKALAENARKAGKSADELADDLAKAGREGYEEGIENGIKKACREAFKKSMRKLREHGQGSSGAGAGGATTEEMDGEYQKLKFDQLKDLESDAKKTQEGEMRLLEVFEVLEPDPDNKHRLLKVKGAYYRSGNKTIRIIRDRIPLE